jgi:hypothetical protein
MTDTRAIGEDRQLSNPFDPSQGFIDDDGPMPVDPWEVADDEPVASPGFLDIEAMRAAKKAR